MSIDRRIVNDSYLGSSVLEIDFDLESRPDALHAGVEAEGDAGGKGDGALAVRYHLDVGASGVEAKFA